VCLQFGLKDSLIEKCPVASQKVDGISEQFQHLQLQRWGARVHRSQYQSLGHLYFICSPSCIRDGPFVGSHVSSPSRCIVSEKDVNKTKSCQHLSSECLVSNIWFVVVYVSGVRQCLWSAATSGPIVCRPGDIWVWRAMVERNWQAKKQRTWKKPVPVPLCPPQIQHGLTWEWTQVSMVRGWRLTAWTMAQPNIQSSYFHDRSKSGCPLSCLCTEIHLLPLIFGRDSFPFAKLAKDFMVLCDRGIIILQNILTLCKVWSWVWQLCVHSVIPSFPY
jgi:hypothetical protein